MKKLLTIVFIMAIFIFPTIASAETFYPEDTDLSIYLDDTKWYVFTRDNLYNNPQLSELGVTYEYIYNFMNNNHVYLDASIFYDNGDVLELLIRKSQISRIENLSNYSDDKVMIFVRELAERQNSQVYDIYKTNYKYSYLKYMDKGLYLVEYCTIVNGEGYTMTFQKTSEFTNDELEDIKTIIDSIEFDVDESPKEKHNETNYRTIITVFTIIFTIAILLFINKKTKLFKK